MQFVISQVSQTEFGQLKAIPLKPGGENIPVTNSNREGALY